MFHHCFGVLLPLVSLVGFNRYSAAEYRDRLYKEISRRKKEARDRHRRHK